MTSQPPLPRVLMLSDVYFPRVNGVSTSIQTFRRDLADLACETHLIAPRYPATWNDEPRIHRVRSRYLPLDPEDRVMVRRDFQRVVAPLKVHVDIVHVQTPFLAHYWGAKLARECKAKLVVTYHTYFEQYFHHYLPLIPPGWLSGLARSISRAQLKNADLVISPSTEIEQALRDYGVAAPVAVLPTGLDLELFRGGDGDRFRRVHGIDPDRPVMLTVGRVAFEKNLSFLIEVLGQVRRQLPDVLFVIAGEGPALDSLHRQATRAGLSDNVLFVGYLDRATGLLDCYRSADVFVFASRTETQGLVLLEAMAVGTPVVSTAVLGTRTVLDGAGGAVVVEEEATGFADAVCGVLADPARQKALSAAGMRDVAARWSGPEMARRLLELYRGLLPNP